MFLKEQYMRTNLVTTHEAASRLQVHPKTVSRLMRMGKLTGVKLANRWLVEESTLEEFSKGYVGRKGRPSGYSPRRRRG